MTYDEALADRIREVLDTESGVTSQRMFGGLGFMVDGHMAVAASGQGGLLARVDPADAPALVHLPGVAPMVMKGRPMAGWLFVDSAALQTDEALEDWIERGVAFVRTLPPKESAPATSTHDRGPIFDGVRIGRPATGALIDAGFVSLSDLPSDLSELRGVHGVGPKAIALLEQARG
jgi:TfoX/Sxy family transcriptional regulator of competence genes